MLSESQFSYNLSTVMQVEFLLKRSSDLYWRFDNGTVGTTRFCFYLTALDSYRKNNVDAEPLGSLYPFHRNKSPVIGNLSEATEHDVKAAGKSAGKTNFIGIILSTRSAKQIKIDTAPPKTRQNQGSHNGQRCLEKVANSSLSHWMI